MPQQHVVFNHPINEQVAIGDSVWFIPGGLSHRTNYTTTGGYAVKSGDLSSAINFGVVYRIDGTNQSPDVVVFYQDGVTQPPTGDYVFFKKDERVNKNNVRGYYASVKLKNNSKEYAELFALSSIIEESSK